MTRRPADPMAPPGHNTQGCTCPDRDRARWRVVTFMANYSAFNGYHRTPSDYSEVRCTGCHSRWRTKAAYVETLTFDEGA